MSPAVEALAEVMAIADGQIARFRACKRSPELEDELGTYRGYMAEAEGGLGRLDVMGWELRKKED